MCGAGKLKAEGREELTMNFAPLRSPSKSPALRSAVRTVLHRHAATRMFAMALIALFCRGSDLATPGTLVANGLNQPRGAIRCNGSVWIADITHGFCPIDAGVINLATCFTPSTSQPELDGN